jgi:hypothetical protein
LWQPARVAVTFDTNHFPRRAQHANGWTQVRGDRTRASTSIGLAPGKTDRGG